MIFKQLFDPVSSTYTYLLAARRGGEALLIDPVLEHVDSYLATLRDMDTQLVLALDTHIHADHLTGIGALRGATLCATAMGEQADAECVTSPFRDDEIISVDGIELKALHTPGHTPDSYSFLMNDRVLTGDTLLIGATGRTDFQGGDPGAQYDSIFERLLTLPDNTRVYPAHDYEGRKSSSIGAERRHNPRLQVATRQEYIGQMNGLDLSPPKLIDRAVPANRNCGIESSHSA